MDLKSRDENQKRSEILKRRLIYEPSKVAIH